MRSLVVLLSFTITVEAGSTVATVLADTPLRGAARADAVDAGTLARGASVIVHHEEGDWLALQPPRGCVSWIGHLFLEFPDNTPNAGFPKNAVVRSDGEVKLAVGKAGVAKPLDVRKTAVPDGTIVLVIGPAVRSESDRTTWYPIVPPEDDFRYVPKSAVQYSTTAPASFVVKSPAPTSATPMPVPAAIAGPVPIAAKAGWPNHPLWLQAEQAETVGDFDRAEKLYFDLAKLMNAPGGDGELANQCYSRVHAIRERRRSGKQSMGNKADGTGEIRKTVSNEARDDNGKIRAAQWNQSSHEPEFIARPASAEARTTASESSSKEKWTGSGFLRLAGFKVGGKQAYALEDSRGRLMVYALPGAADLDKHRNKTVDLFGTSTSPKDLRGVSLVEVSKIDLLK